MAGKCTHRDAKEMEWEELCELNEAIDYESDYNHLAAKKARAKNG